MGAFVSEPRARPAVLVGALLFCVYAWFHQGGGWSQNVRFDQVRAVVEQGVLHVDDYLLYAPELGPAGALRYRRLPLSDPATHFERLPRLNSLDLSLHDGHYYPNKPPGVTLLAAPVYAVLRAVERLAGLDPDAPGAYWLATANLYLLTAVVVGGLAALGGACLFDVSRRLRPDLAPGVHAGAALAYGLGTLVLPYATLLVDHALVATLSLLALRGVLVAAAADIGAHRTRALFLAGTAAGLGVVTNHSAALVALALGAYAGVRLRGARPAAGLAAYAAGGIAPALLLALYQWHCFGDPLALPQTHQLGLFRSEAPLLQVFGLPDPTLLPDLLVLPYRGLFFHCPVLVAAVAGLVLLHRGGHRAEAGLAAALFAAFLALNASFNAWHGGGSVGPRYLVPAIPFLALGLAPALARWRKATLAAAALSVAIMGTVTVVDPQVDASIRNPLVDFYLPLVAGGRVANEAFVHAGPVSTHAGGIAGAGLELHAPDTPTQAWNAFNLGEALFPQSLWSLLPLAALVALLGAALARQLRTGDGTPRS